MIYLGMMIIQLDDVVIFVNILCLLLSMNIFVEIIVSLLLINCIEDNNSSDLNSHL